MALEKGMLLFFDGDPSKDEMFGMMKALKQKFRKLQTRKRERDDSTDSSKALPDDRKRRKKRSLKRKLAEENTEGAVSEEHDTQEGPNPTDSCAVPTVKVRKIPKTQHKKSVKKERKLDSRLKRLLKSKQKNSKETELASDECSTTSSDSGIHLVSEQEGFPTSSQDPSVEPHTVISIPAATEKLASGTCLPQSRWDSLVDSAHEKIYELPQTEDRQGPDSESSTGSCSNRKPAQVDESLYVAMDCEFVGVGPKGCRSALGRCSVVDFWGRTLCDVYARPEDPITDYRTRFSGIRPRHMKTAIPLESARRIVKKVLRNKIVIGHAVWNDFNVLGIRHPPDMIRDTFSYSPLHQMASENDNPPRSLKKLSAALLGRDIQNGPHSSVEDSLAVLDLFKLVRHRWEEELAQQEKVHTAAKHRRNRTVSETSVENAYLDDDYWPCDI